MIQDRGRNTYHIHVYAIGVGPGMLEVFLQPLPERVGDLVKAYELFDLLHLGVVAGGTRIEALYDGTDVTKDTGIH